MMSHDEETLKFFDGRRVTRDQFENFQRSQLEQGSPAYTILKQLDPNKRQQLLDIGKGVCRIDISGTPKASGFHLGNGWVMTNQHVICEGDAVTSSDLTFVFPDLAVPARRRKVLFSHFTDPEGTRPVDESKNDLALVNVEELLNPQNRIRSLGNVFQRKAKEDEPVYLIHYGDGTNQPSPQQFSISKNKALSTVRNENGIVITKHSAHCRPGSSGAPLLVYGNSGFFVAGVHFAASEDEYEQDSPGLALLLNDWLTDTLLLVDYMDRMYIHPQPVKDCQELQKELTACSMRAEIPRHPPDGVIPQNFPDIIWKP